MTLEELEKPFLTGKFRVSYEHILQPWAGSPGDRKRYSMQCIVPKGEKWIEDTIKRCKAIGKLTFGNDFERLVKAQKLRFPIRDGDLEDNEIYHGMWYFNSNGAGEGKAPPQLIDQKRRDMRKLKDPGRFFYSGVYARAWMKFYGYDQKGGRGVTSYPYSIQFLETGERLGGGPSVESIFDEVEGGEDVFAEDAMHSQNSDYSEDNEVPFDADEDLDFLK